MEGLGSVRCSTVSLGPTEHVISTGQVVTMMLLGSRRTLSILELVLLSSIDIINSTIRESRSSDPLLRLCPCFHPNLRRSSSLSFHGLPLLVIVGSGLEPSSNGGSSLGGKTRSRGGSWREKIGLHVQVVIPGDEGYHRSVNAGFSPGGGSSLSFTAAGSSSREGEVFSAPSLPVLTPEGRGSHSSTLMIVRVRMDELSVEDGALHRRRLDGDYDKRRKAEISSLGFKYPFDGVEPFKVRGTAGMRQKDDKPTRASGYGQYMRVVNPSLCIDGAQPLVYLPPPPPSSHFPANGKFHERCYYPTSVSMQSQSKRSVFACNAALNAKCSQGQTQTVTRESPTITQAPTHGKEKSPKLDDGGSGFPPRDDGGGGGGGGGGESFSGGFFLFGFLMFMGYLKDLEGEHETSH
ncbi:hypothetical protein IGI04_026547 [Brassica rapa subsp. trilocularis]|uniref:Uncharacterized protein n=1 Tax=Brassica rapa subsp. trilocularis TaxID=1813537 RepID=A0ABQ7KWD4_BRACM|nr:hypothetical protein IGI04_026547 [Brassica rapa subsp. trilocularis]